MVAVVVFFFAFLLDDMSSPNENQPLAIKGQFSQSVTVTSGPGETMPGSDQNRLRALHERLLSGDRFAIGELIDFLFLRLLADVGRQYPRFDEQKIFDGVLDALLGYCDDPQSFDRFQEKVPLDRFLAAAAWRNVDNLWKAESRIHKREQHVAEKKTEKDVASDPAARILLQEAQQEFEERIGAMLQALQDPSDRVILLLHFQGIHDLATFARALALTDLPLEEQRKEVKRRKDRIMKFLRRKGLL